jgi:hypothetical protein
MTDTGNAVSEPERAIVSSNDEQSAVRPHAIEMTFEDVEKLTYIIEGRIRNEVLEYIHQHISDDEMGPIRDRIRGCVYEILNGFFVTPAPRLGMEEYWKMMTKPGFELYPIDVTEHELESQRRIVAHEEYEFPKGDLKEEQEQANARREAAFARKGPFSPED